MLFMLRIIEWGWLAVTATLVIALLMFFLRRKSRLAYQRRLEERAHPKA